MFTKIKLQPIKHLTVDAILRHIIPGHYVLVVSELREKRFWD